MRVFRELCPEAPVRILGAALPDWPELTPLDDPREGPAEALRHWARNPESEAERWWVVACDLPHWSPAALAAWMARACSVDPKAECWVLARVEDRIQFLGGFLPSGLRTRLAAAPGRSLHALMEALPHRILDAEGPEWEDLDEPGS